MSRRATGEGGWAARRGFTLVELLVVCAMIAILAGILLPALAAMRTRSREARARAEIDQIVTAWRAYYSDYRAFPTVTITDMGQTAISILRGRHAENPRGFCYLEFPVSATNFLDPWGSVYQVALDDNYDNWVTATGTGQLWVAVAAWSPGEDMASGTSDDVASWKRR